MQRGWRQAGQGWALALMLAAGLAACAAPAPRLERPRGVVVAADGSLVVANAADLLALRLDDTGRVEQTFALGQARPGQSVSVWDIARDPQDNLYFCVIRRDEAQTIHDGIEVYTPAGNFLREIGGQDYGRNAAGKPNLPYGLAIDAAGRVYVAEYGANALRVFDAQGNLLTTFFGAAATHGLFAGLNDVALDEPRHLLYAVDSDGQQVVQFQLGVAADGTPALSPRLILGGYGSAPGQLAFPVSAMVDPQTGEVYVGDLANQRIQVFATDGRYERSLGVSAVADWEVMGLALGPAGTVYAADPFNQTLWAFTPQGQARRIETHR